MKIKVDTRGLDTLKAQLRGLQEKKIKTAQVSALNEAAFSAAKAARGEIAKVFDRPTPLIQRSVVYFKAGLAGRKVRVPGAFNIDGSGLMTALQADRLEAVVDLSGEINKQGVSPDQVLNAQIRGGQRRHKRHEVALQRIGILPSGMYIVTGQAANVDQYGNMSSGQINQILSYFSAFAEQGYRANMTAAARAKRAKGTKRACGFEYFVVRPGDKRTWSRGEGKAVGSHRMQPGIYQRVFSGFGTAIRPVMIFVSRANYRARLDFYGVAERTAVKAFNNAYPRYLAQMLKERGL